MQDKTEERETTDYTDEEPCPFNNPSNISDIRAIRGSACADPPGRKNPWPAAGQAYQEKKKIMNHSMMKKAANIKKLVAILRRHYKKFRSPVATLSRCHGNAPFETLVATILSSRTLDQTTTAVCRKLFRVVRGPRDLKRISLRKLEKMIYPAGFYRVKARQLKELPATLDRLFNGKIPDTTENLMRLPGVGRKTANLVAALAFNRAEICVDVHVQRIGNRLGLVRTKTPRETEEALKRIVPKKYWRELNHLLVAFGQTACRPRHPKCGTCPLRTYCRFANKS